jgi:hypothetical protein
VIDFFTSRCERDSQIRPTASCSTESCQAASREKLRLNSCPDRTSLRAGSSRRCSYIWSAPTTDAPAQVIVSASARASASSSDAANPMPVVGVGTCVASPTNATRWRTSCSGTYSAMGVPMTRRRWMVSRTASRHGDGKRYLASCASSRRASTAARSLSCKADHVAPSVGVELKALGIEAEPSRCASRPSTVTLRPTAAPVRGNLATVLPCYRRRAASAFGCLRSDSPSSIARLR